MVSHAGADAYDLVLIAVTGDQLDTACASLTVLVGAPTILLLGNSSGREAVPGAVRGGFAWAFPELAGGSSAEPLSTSVSSRSPPHLRLFMTLAWRPWRRISADGIRRPADR